MRIASVDFHFSLSGKEYVVVCLCLSPVSLQFIANGKLTFRFENQFSKSQKLLCMLKKEQLLINSDNHVFH